LEDEGKKKMMVSLYQKIKVLEKVEGSFAAQNKGKKGKSKCKQ
jgi:hypothetical protein